VGHEKVAQAPERGVHVERAGEEGRSLLQKGIHLAAAQKLSPWSVNPHWRHSGASSTVATRRRATRPRAFVMSVIYLFVTTGAVLLKRGSDIVA
jgi:hypothetical protein